MTPILTAAEMREADRRAIKELGFPGLVLMENAARGAFDVLDGLLESVQGKSLLVLCGPGNNGGDGLALARHAMIAGAEVTCSMIAGDKVSGDMQAQLKMLSTFGDNGIVEWKTLRRRSREYDVTVDAMLGTGAKGALRGPYAEAVRWANKQTGLKFALDIPTGIDADTGIAEGDFFLADATATMAALKPGLLLNEGAVASGDIYIVHIGTPSLLYAPSSLELLDAGRAAAGITVIEPRWNKYDRGKVLVLAGARGMTGAGAMTAEAVLRSGAGLVVYAMPEDAAQLLPQRLPPEIMTLFLPSNYEGAFASAAFDQISEELDRFSSIAIGPGLSKSKDTAQFVRAVISRARVPVVLDADGLDAFTEQPDTLADRTSELILTPHFGEMARLTGIDKELIAADPVRIARETAERFNAIVVLKGAPTVVAAPDGRAWINAAGNPGMATGGTGDVLTGIIASFAARADNLVDSVLAAVFIHSDAGDRAAAHRTEYSMVATDIITYLSDSFQSFDQ
jgi:NAD(P)H-hydrate epimerase